MSKRDLIIDYELVRGMPGDVVQRVRELLTMDGWQPFGEPKIIKIDGCEVMIQPMAQYEN